MPNPQNILLCLNLRSELLVGGAARASKISSVLEKARRQDWRVVHAFGSAQRAAGQPYGALQGLEPLATESVFALRSANAFSEPGLAAVANGTRPAASILVVGGAFSRIGLATALAARDLSLKLRLAEEACFATRTDAVAAEHILAIVQPSQHGAADRAKGGNVICLKKWRA